MKYPVAAIILAVLVAAGTPPAHAQADWAPQSLRHSELSEEGAEQGGGSYGVTLEQAVQQVRQRTGGRILSAETVSQDGRPVHRIKVMTPQHHVKVYYVDAEASGSQ